MSFPIEQRVLASGAEEVVLLRNPEEDTDALQRENASLRSRVAELERQLCRSACVLNVRGVASNAAQSRVSPEALLEQTLVQREALLLEAARIVHLGCWVWNIPDNFVIWSDELYRILGYDADLDHASVENFFERLHPEDRDRVRSVSQRIIATGVHEQVECRVLLPSGTIRHVTVDGALLHDEAGRVRQAVGTLLDTTEARKSARELEYSRALLEEAQQIANLGSFSLNLDQTQAHWSNQCYPILGLPATQELSFTGFLALVQCDDQTELQSRFDHLLANGVWDPYTFRLLRADGCVRQIHARAVRVMAETGNVVGLRGTLQDVTDHAELRQQVEQLQRLEAIGRLAGGVAHDFNNLLTVIVGNLELLEGVEPDRRELKDIALAAEAAAGLTEQLLTFGRKAVLRTEVVTLNSVIEETRRLIERTIGEDIDFNCEVLESLWPVNIDARQVQQVMLNLAINARDAMPDGGRLTLSATNAVVEASHARRCPRGKPGDYVVLSVSDSGTGMSAETRQRAFEPFYTTKEAGSGTGLGLSMVFGVLSQSGGFVELDTRLGKGTAVRLYFPKYAGPAQAKKCRTTRAQDERGMHGRILLVEDDARVRRVATAQLESLGFTVSALDDPEKALLMVQHRSSVYDLLITDLVMPKMHGVALARSTREQMPRLPVIFITGYPTDAKRFEGFARPWAHLAKPFRRLALKSCIDAVLAREPDSACAG